MTTKVVEHKATNKVTKVSKISSDKPTVEVVEPILQLSDPLSEITVKKHKEDDAFSDISDMESIICILPSKRNANRDILLKGNERTIQAEKGAKIGNSHV